MSATSPEERTWGMACHLSALAMYILPYFGNILGPLIVWLVQKDRLPFADDQSKESLNFQISLTIYSFALLIIGFIAVVTIIGIVLLPAILVLAGVLWVFQLVMIIIASIDANKGIRYRYPLNLRLIM